MTNRSVQSTLCYRTSSIATLGRLVHGYPTRLGSPSIIATAMQMDRSAERKCTWGTPG